MLTLQHLLNDNACHAYTLAYTVLNHGGTLAFSVPSDARLNANILSNTMLNDRLVSVVLPYIMLCERTLHANI